MNLSLLFSEANEVEAAEQMGQYYSLLFGVSKHLIN